MKLTDAQRKALERLRALGRPMLPYSAAGISSVTMRILRDRELATGGWLIGWTITPAGLAALNGETP